MQLTEITPIQHSKHRSLGVPYIMMENRIITMRSETFDTAVLCYDHLNLSLADTHEIICSMSDLKVQFVRYRAYSYLKRLKTYINSQAVGSIGMKVTGGKDYGFS